MSMPRSDSTSSQLTSIVTFALVMLALYFAREIVLPFALAILLSFLLTPLVRRLERLGTPRVPSVLAVALVAFTLIGVVGWVVTSQVIDLSARLPEYKGNLVGKVRGLSGVTNGKIEKATETIKEIGEELTKDDIDGAAARADGANGQRLVGGTRGIMAYLLGDRASGGMNDRDDAVEVKVVALPPSPLSQVRTWLGPLVAPLTTGGVVVILTLFMSIRREDMRNRVIQLVGTAHLRTTTEALDQATKRVMDLLRMQLMINAIYGTVVGVGLYFIGVPNAFLWGVLGLLLRFLPYVGPWLVAAMPIALSLAVFDDWSHTLMTISLFVGLELVVNNVLEPWLYGTSTGVSSVGIIVSAIFWTWFWGPIGLVIAMPLTVCLVVAGNFVPQMRFLTILLGDRSTLKTEEQLYQRLLALDDEEADRLADEYLRHESTEQFYDDVILPALCMAERDRHRGVLTSEQESTLLDTTREMVEELGGEPGAPETGFAGQASADALSRTDGSERKMRVLCVPGRDKADEITAIMLSQLLSAAGMQVETRSTDVLAAELVEYVRAGDVDAVVIAAVPPAAARHARYLCKRLRAQLPELPIIVGLWRGSHLTRTLRRLAESGVTGVVHSLDDAVQEIQSLNRLDRPPSPNHVNTQDPPSRVVAQ